MATETLPYYHDIPKSEAEALIADKPDGTYLVRPKGKTEADGYILTVTYKGKPSHHALAIAAGKCTLNKKEYGGHATAGEMLEELKTKTAGWPVVMNNPVMKDGGGGGDDAVQETAESLPYFHDVGKTEAEKLIGTDDGTFLVRNSVKDGASTTLLTVVYKGKPTHHQLAYIDGVATLNKKPFGSHKKLSELVAYLGAPGIKGWPVALTTPIAGKGGAAAEPEAAAAEPAPKSEPPVEAAKEPEPEPEPEPAKVPEPKPEPEKAHPAVSNEQKKAKKKAAPAPEEEDEDNLFGKVREAGFQQHRADTVISPTAYNDAQQYGDRYWQDKRKMKKEIEDQNEAEKEAAIKANSQSIVESIKAKKAKKQASIAPPAAKPIPKSQQVIMEKLEVERLAAAAAEKEAKQAVKDAKKAAKESEKATAAETAALEEQKRIDEEYLASLPAWKRDKVLRVRAADEAESKRIEEDRAARLQEMRESKATNMAQIEKARLQRMKDSAAAAKREKAEKAAAVERSVKEVEAAQMKMRSKLGK